MTRRLFVALVASLSLTTSLRAAEQPLRAVIDAEVRAVWQREKITPPALADDTTFLRRI